MNLQSYIATATMALLVVPRLAIAQGNVVINGGFDNNANGWVIVNTPGGFGWESVGGTPGGCVLLDNIAPSPSADPTASQTIGSLTPGITYDISGQYQQGKDRGGGSPGTPSFGVAVDGVFLFEAVAPGNYYDWHNFDLFYTATSPSAVLSLSSQINGTGVSYVIDNIAMEAVPEPSSLSLFSIGVLAICFRMKRPNTALEPTASPALVEVLSQSGTCKFSGRGSALGR